MCQTDFKSQKKAGLLKSKKGTSLKALLFWEPSTHPDCHCNQDSSVWAARECLIVSVCNQGTTRSLSQTLHDLCYLRKWAAYPRRAINNSSYSRHALDPCLKPDPLLCSLSIWLSFLALVSVTLIIWQLSFWRLGALASFPLEKNEGKKLKAKIRILPFPFRGNHCSKHFRGMAFQKFSGSINTHTHTLILHIYAHMRSHRKSKYHNAWHTLNTQ